MFRIPGLTLVATAALCSASFAATVDRIRGTVTAVSPDSVNLHTTDGKDLAVTLRDNTRYANVVKASLTDVAPGSYIGTATKEVGGKLIALEVVVFPPAMKGVGEGHYGWDRIRDTTLSGGAMDLAAGAKRLWVMMAHTAKDGSPKLVQRCTYPLTAVGAVKRVYTNLAVVDVTERGFVVLDIVPGLSFEDLQARTDAKLHRAS
ncbi:MAG: hypothetical protein J0H35_07675 [Rhodospirillales bacterium]|nr:hypothetical protein [Rhodospirillales bacterium]